MRKITKTDENTVVWMKPDGNSAIQKRKILRVWEDADSFEFKYGNWDSPVADKDGFSYSTYRDVTSRWQIAETIARYDQPLNFCREIKIAAIRVIHLFMERMAFNLKN